MPVDWAADLGANFQRTCLHIVSGPWSPSVAPEVALWVSKQNLTQSRTPAELGSRLFCLFGPQKCPLLYF